MPPMSTPRTFIEALRTGQTRTTKALERVLSRRRSAKAEQLAEAIAQRGALKAPLQPALRKALRDAGVSEREINGCIDAWPNPLKEQARRAIARALSDGRRVHVRWGLTAARACEAQVDDSAEQSVTITALSPRSSLRLRANNDIAVAPAVAPSRRSPRATGRRSTGRG